MDNRSISHTQWKCQYHIVFIPKYRKKVLYGKVRDDVREIISVLCKYKDVEIIAGAVCKSCTSKCGNSTKAKYFEFYGILEEQKYIDDIRQTSRTTK